ncbi:hypothetical protein B0H17DRAFT_1198337 [Mycena rosella]|uniref:Retrotransposon gag domain-containing protein n=1 Tax=Mycena rosella TaxID=1033263 RepID=A0AAD7DPE0_MYCRO|nr:hypothetical protein B0H17DRAFT_1198337 [Mycena rosella]
MTTESLTSAFHDALSGATFHTTSQPSTSQSADRTSSFCVDLSYFRSVNKNVRAWWSILEDQLKAVHIAREDWVVTVSGLFHDGALTWYLSKEQEYGGQLSSINALYQELKAQFNSPTHVDEIH